MDAGQTTSLTEWGRRARHFLKRTQFKREFGLLGDVAYLEQSLETLRKMVRGKRVALVGNASSIFGTGFGPEIDAHDVIVRMNKGAVREPSDQGSRTDVLGVSCRMPWSWAVSTFQPAQVLWLTPNHISMSSTFLRHFDEMAVAPGRYWDELRKRLGGARPSSGLIAIDLFRHSLEPQSIRLFGFDWKASPTYYNASNDQLGPHGWTEEADLVRQWMKDDPRLTLAVPPERVG